MDSTGLSLIWLLIFSLIGIVLWFFLNRASVRANRQVELLESINSKLTDFMNTKSVTENVNQSNNKSDAEYLEEARKKAGL